jgi:hypothetical protein
MRRREILPLMMDAVMVARLRQAGVSRSPLGSGYLSSITSSAPMRVAGGTMHLGFRTSHIVSLFLLMGSLGGTSYVAYQIVGFLGVGVLGLITGGIALTVELEQVDLLATVKPQVSTPSTWPLWSACPPLREPKGGSKSRARHCRCP